MRTNDILTLIKTHSSLTSEAIANELAISKEGARLQLNQLIEQGLVQSFKASRGVGRPKTHYKLTEKGHNHFPDRHSELTADLIEHIRSTLGEKALTQVIQEREKQKLKRYKGAINQSDGLKQRVEKLAKMRSQEGYMAEVKKQENGYLLIEHHCPICTAASHCQSFCRFEWDTFNHVLGDNAAIERIEHLMKGDQRCIYFIQDKEA